MAIPILRRVTPFNAENSFIFNFNVVGSSQQIMYNKLIVRLSSDTSQIIYEDKIQEFRYQHTVPSNTLSNGTQYVAHIQVFSQGDVLLGESDPIFFYCLSDPVLKIPTIVNGEVGNQTVMFEGTYNQAESEPLQSFQFILYNDNQDELTRSPEIFSQAIQFEFSELESRQRYYVELKITTVNELGATTGLIEFIPRYIAPRFDSAIELSNLPDEASVFIKCNVIRIIGIPDIDPVIYENDGAINLVDNGVWFDEGFKLRNDWTIQMWLRDVVDNSVFFKLFALDGSHIKLRLKDGYISMQKMLDDDYIVQSLLGENAVDSNKTIHICIKHIEGHYDFSYSEVIA